MAQPLLAGYPFGLRRIKLAIFLIGGLALNSAAWAVDRADVLLIAAPGARGVGAVVDALRRPPRDAAGRSRMPVSVEVRLLPSRQTPTEFARELKSQVKSYKAVFATSTELARAVQREDSGVPIVFKGESDPVSSCLADTMQKPGRNATGYVDYLPDDDRKLMEALVLGYPRLRTIYIMVDYENFYVPDCGPLSRNPKPAPPTCVPGEHPPGSELEWMQETPEALDQARKLGVSVKFMLLCGREDFARFAEIGPFGSEVGFVFSLHALFWRHAKELVANVARARHPAIYGRAMFAEVGGLMALEPILDASDERAAVELLWQVLDGRAPATLPIQVPRGFRLIVNARAGAAQGLVPSLALLRRADVVLSAGTR